VAIDCRNSFGLEKSESATSNMFAAVGHAERVRFQSPATQSSMVDTIRSVRVREFAFRSSDPLLILTFTFAFPAQIRLASRAQQRQSALQLRKPSKGRRSTAIGHLTLQNRYRVSLVPLSFFSLLPQISSRR
jgi:hypothetical protein